MGDWINYVLSPFSWLKSTLLPLDSLCLCLRRRQMDRACHPVQALPSLLSQTWTFRSEHWGGVCQSASQLLLCCVGFCFVFHSLSLSLSLPLSNSSRLVEKNEFWARLLITHTMICGNNFRFSKASYVCQERWVATAAVYRIRLLSDFWQELPTTADTFDSFMDFYLFIYRLFFKKPTNVLQGPNLCLQIACHTYQTAPNSKYVQ